VGVGDENREDDDVVTVTMPTTDDDAGDPPIPRPTANRDPLIGAKAHA